MELRRWAGLLCICLFASTFITGLTGADRGGIPLDPTVHFEESAQNAIVAWNGQKECLILSTDLRSPSPGRLLEMLPLPTAPYDIQLGNTSSFKTMVKLFNEKAERLRVVSPRNSKETTGLGGDAVGGYQGVEIVFSTSFGLHNITVVKIESQVHFVDWARDFAARHGASNLSIGEGLNWTVGDHLNRGISYFVFDVVDLSVERRTSEPMVYLFNTTYLYYPLRITYETLDGEMSKPNDITLFLVTDGVIKDGDSHFDGVHPGAGIDEFIEFTPSELRKVSGPLAGLFFRSAFVTHYFGTYYGRGHIIEEIDDIVLNAGNIRRPSTDELKAQYERADYLTAIEPIAPSLGYYLLRGRYDPGYALPGNLLILVLMGIFLTPVTLGFMFKGIIERGQKRGTLWIVWLVLYAMGIAGISVIAFLGAISSDFKIGTLFVILALALPLLVVAFLGERFKKVPVRGRWTVPGISYGMGGLLTFSLVFTPISMMGALLAGLCLPMMGILGVITVIGILVARTRKPGPTAWHPPSH